MTATRVGRQPVGDLARDGRLARAGAAGDADEKGSGHSQRGRSSRPKRRWLDDALIEDADALAAVDGRARRRRPATGRGCRASRPARSCGSSRPTRRSAGWRRTGRGRALRTARTGRCAGSRSMSTCRTAASGARRPAGPAGCAGACTTGACRSACRRDRRSGSPGRGRSCIASAPKKAARSRRAAASSSVMTPPSPACPSSARAQGGDARRRRAAAAADGRRRRRRTSARGVTRERLRRLATTRPVAHLSDILACGLAHTGRSKRSRSALDRLQHALGLDRAVDADGVGQVGLERAHHLGDRHAVRRLQSGGTRHQRHRGDERQLAARRRGRRGSRPAARAGWNWVSRWMASAPASARAAAASA